MSQNKKDQKSKPVQNLLDAMSMMMMSESGQGMVRSSALKKNKCVKCGQDATKFKDSLSKREYSISGLCQVCQDKIFG